MSTLELLRSRYERGEPLLQAGDTFDFMEGMSAIDTIVAEAKDSGLPPPVAFYTG